MTNTTAIDKQNAATAEAMRQARAEGFAAKREAELAVPLAQAKLKQAREAVLELYGQANAGADVEPLHLAGAHASVELAEHALKGATYRATSADRRVPVDPFPALAALRALEAADLGVTWRLAPKPVREHTGRGIVGYVAPVRIEEVDELGGFATGVELALTVFGSQHLVLPAEAVREALEGHDLVRVEVDHAFLGESQDYRVRADIAWDEIPTLAEGVPDYAKSLNGISIPLAGAFYRPSYGRNWASFDSVKGTVRVRELERDGDVVTIEVRERFTLGIEEGYAPDNAVGTAVGIVNGRAAEAVGHGVDGFGRCTDMSIEWTGTGAEVTATYVHRDGRPSA